MLPILYVTGCPLVMFDTVSEIIDSKGTVAITAEDFYARKKAILILVLLTETRKVKTTDLSL